MARLTTAGKGFQISHYTHTHQVAFLPSPRQWKIWTSRLRRNNINYSSRQFRFPVWYFKGIHRTSFKQDNIRRTEAEKEAWSNKFVADAANNNLDHVGTLKYMNLLLQLYTPSKCQIYNKWTVHEHKCLSSFLVFRFSSIWERERERERGYTKFGIRRNSPKGTYLISLMELRGESFFFYGLIDFMLFLTLAWRTWVPRVRDIFLSSSPGVLAFALSATSPVQ